MWSRLLRFTMEHPKQEPHALPDSGTQNWSRKLGLGISLRASNKAGFWTPNAFRILQKWNLKASTYLVPALASSLIGNGHSLHHGWSRFWHPKSVPQICSSGTWWYTKSGPDSSIEIRSANLLSWIMLSRTSSVARVPVSVQKQCLGWGPTIIITNATIQCETDCTGKVR